MINRGLFFLCKYAIVGCFLNAEEPWATGSGKLLSDFQSEMEDIWLNTAIGETDSTKP